MPAYLNSVDLQDHYLGSTLINSLWFGEDNIWTRTTPPPILISGSFFIGGYTGSQAELENKLNGETLINWAIIGGNTVATSSTSYKIASSAFSSNQTITKYLDDSACIEIESSAFIDCQNLIEILFPKTVQIGTNAFTQCSNLSSVSFPNVTSVDAGCFNLCTSLSTISLPKTNLVSQFSFFNCTALTLVSLPSLIAPNGLGGNPALNNVFTDVPESGSITIPISFSTNNSGNPDADLQYLSGIGWTINYV